MKALLASLALMHAAIERGDIDEAARQGNLAGPAVVATALASEDRVDQLAAIAAASTSEASPELLEPLALTAAGPDRRTALPAARAAKRIAVDLLQAVMNDAAPDDYAPADLDAWRMQWSSLALRADRWVELRLLALDICGTLADAIAMYPTTERPDLGAARELGVDPVALAQDPDPAIAARGRL